MAHYVMIGEGVHPAARIKRCHREQLERSRWINGQLIDFEVPEPVLYDLDPLYPGEPKMLYHHLPVPVMHVSVYQCLVECGVDNVQTYKAILRDLEKGVEYKDYLAFNVVGKIAAADMSASTMMGTSDSTIIDADFDSLHIDESKCQDALIFRLAENVSAIIVDEKIKKKIEKNKIQGIFFYASGEWSG